MVRAHMAARCTKCIAFAPRQVKTWRRPLMYFHISRITQRTLSQITANLMNNATKGPSRRADICGDGEGHTNVSRDKARVATPPRTDKDADHAAVCSRCTTEVVSSLALRSLSYIAVRDNNSNASKEQKASGRSWRCSTILPSKHTKPRPLRATTKAQAATPATSKRARSSLMAKILPWTSCERGAASRCTEEVDQASALTIHSHPMAKEERRMAQHNAERLEDTRQQYC
jgi:hypothetical protein